MKKTFALVLLISVVFLLFQQTRANLFDSMILNGLPEKKALELRLPRFSPRIEAQGAILITQDEGEILYSKKAHERLYPASTTKMLTALLAIEHGDLDEKITVGNEICGLPLDASKAGLYEGQSISMRDLLYALLLPSGNDAAITIAVHIARENHPAEKLSNGEALEVFSNLMNQRAQEAGAKDSHFNNPHGCHCEDHYSTAYDMAIIAQEVMQEPFLREVVRTEEYSPKNPKSDANIFTWENTNKLLDQNSPLYYPNTTGIKTGYTSEAGYCLVSSASQNGLDIIAVVLNSTESGVWKDTTRLLQYGFKEYYE